MCVCIARERDFFIIRVMLFFSCEKSQCVEKTILEMISYMSYMFLNIIFLHTVSFQLPVRKPHEKNLIGYK